MSLSLPASVCLDAPGPATSRYFRSLAREQEAIRASILPCAERVKCWQSG